MGREYKIGLLLLILLIIFFLLVSFSVAKSYILGLSFSNQCQELNTKEFTYQNLSSLEGYIRPAALAAADEEIKDERLESFDKEQFDKYLVLSEEIIQPWGRNKSLSVYDKNFIFTDSFRTGWVCDAQRILDNNTIKSKSFFTRSD